jgi:hypothetical protein
VKTGRHNASAGIPQPWLADALELLDLRRNDRVLVFSAPTMAHVSAVRQSVGSSGRTMVIEPDLVVAEEIAQAARADVEVVNRVPSAGESLGDFDAMLVCPLMTLGLEPAFWGDLFSNNLRPGGRFVLDLPGEEMNEQLASCWLESEGEADALDPLRGPSKEEVVEALEEAGLRDLSASAATHLVHLESPFALVGLMRDGADLNKQRAEDLGRRLVERLKTAEEVDVIFHRTRVRGLH